jgi:hypothetical protein
MVFFSSLDYLTTLPVSRLYSGGLMDISKETDVAHLRYYPGTCPEGLRKPTNILMKRGVRAKIRTEPLRHTTLERIR